MSRFLSENELKESYKNKGGFKAAVNDTKNYLHIKPNSFKTWNGLFTLIADQNNQDIIQSTSDIFFVSEAGRLIFALTKLEGEVRAEMLGITKELYSSSSKSKKWKNKIIKIIHPDRCNHPLSSEATSQLNKIYENMKKYGK